MYASFKALIIDLFDALAESLDNWTAREARRAGKPVPQDVLERREQRAARAAMRVPR